MAINILIPVDYSSISINAIDYATHFFGYRDANFYLLNVYVSAPSSLLSDNYNEDWFKQIDDDSHAQLVEIVELYNAKKSKGHAFYDITKSNSLIGAVKQVVKEKAIDLIITGTKGASGLKEIFIGSNTVKLINQIDNCPILVVPNLFKFDGLTQIVFSTNFKRGFNNHELKMLVDISLHHNNTVNVVQLIEEDYLSPQQKAHKTELTSCLADIDINFQKLNWEDSETKTIQHFMVDTHSELLALINHKHNFLNKLLQENVIQKVTFHALVPILILPEHLK